MDVLTLQNKDLIHPNGRKISAIPFLGRWYYLVILSMFEIKT